jgi:hypothetical protein
MCVMKIIRILLGMTAICMAASAADAGVGGEAMGARVNGNWGGEIGAGYSLGMAGFSLTPGGGVEFDHGDTHAYGRIEAAYRIPLFARLGAGVRIGDGHARPYGTVALPIIPLVAVKANGGPHYAAIGLTLGY